MVTWGYLLQCFFVGGLPMVVLECFKQQGIHSRIQSVRKAQKDLKFMVSQYSPFLQEGKNVLIEEFGKEYGTYFSILELISRGKTSRGEIESVMGKNIGGYLSRLENDYNIISRVRPINAKSNARLVKYCIKDHFLKFWFRFIHRN